MEGKKAHTRAHCDDLVSRLSEPRKHIQVVAGSRQVGKTTLVLQALARIEQPHVFASGDVPTLKDMRWLEAQWDSARELTAGGPEALLVLDEIQKIMHWSEVVKLLWDEDARNGTPLRVVLLGSAPLLLGKGLSESLTGRFEMFRLPHWGYGEMRDAFGWSLDEHIFHGGYPGTAEMVGKSDRWKAHVLDGIVETVIGRDVLSLTRIANPALLRRLVELGCRHSSQILSLRKMTAELQETTNTTTIANYLELLAGVGLLVGIQKYSTAPVRVRSSPPKLAVLNTALMSAMSPHSLPTAKADRAFWGRLVESAVGAHLANAAASRECELFYWRDHRGREVDYVVRMGTKVTAIEVKSGHVPRRLKGLAAFSEAHPGARTLLVGGDGIPLERFLSRPVKAWAG